MLSIKQIYNKDYELCYELDSNTIALWSKKQWDNELRKEGVKAFGLLFLDLVIGICVLQVVLEEGQINYFAVDQEFRERGFGSYLMRDLIQRCKQFNINKLLLEVSQSNVNAKKFYDRFGFSTVGIRRNYYKDGSDALLKEKILVMR